MHVGNWRLQQLPVIAKRNEPSVKQVINAWSQKQAICSGESLFVVGLPPRLDMAGNKMLRIHHLSYPASTLNRTHSLAEFSLANPRFDQCNLFSLSSNI
jgi:hypothetical protein